MDRLILPARIDNLGAFVEFVTKRALQAGFSEEGVLEVELAMEEAVVNIVKHAYSHDEGQIELGCKFDVNVGQLIVELTDSGKPFDILAAPIPNIGASLEDRQEGGLGVTLIKEVANEIRSDRLGDKNILQMSINLR